MTRNFYWSRASVCLSAFCMSVCLFVAVCPHYCTDPDVTWGNGRGCPVVVHYWADLQSVHGLHCYGDIARTRNVSECFYSLCAWLYFVTLSIEHRLSFRSSQRTMPYFPGPFSTAGAAGSHGKRINIIVWCAVRFAALAHNSTSVICVKKMQRFLCEWVIGSIVLASFLGKFQTIDFWNYNASSDYRVTLGSRSECDVHICRPIIAHWVALYSCPYPAKMLTAISKFVHRYIQQ